MSEPVFENYRVGDRVRITRPGELPVTGEVVGNVHRTLIVGIPGTTYGVRVPYSQVEMIDPNPKWPIETRGKLS